MNLHNFKRMLLGAVAGATVLGGMVSLPQPAAPAAVSGHETARPAVTGFEPTATPTPPVNDGECQDSHCGRTEA